MHERRFKCRSAINSLIICAVVWFFFGSAPSAFFPGEVNLTPAYEQKIINPFCDTSKPEIAELTEHSGERSHGNKLTPRIIPALAINVTNRINLSPYAPAFLGGIVLLLSGWAIAYSITLDRAIARATMLLYSGLFACSGCFTVFGNAKPFDGVAIGLLAIASAFTFRPFLLVVFSFLALWCDERSMVGLAIIAATAISTKEGPIKSRLTTLTPLVIATIFYAVSRMVVAAVFDWNHSDFSFLGLSVMGKQMDVPQLALWIPVEGAWLIIIAILHHHAYIRPSLRTLVWIGLVFLASIGSIFLALDTSRSSSYLFPLIPFFLVWLRKTDLPIDTQRKLMGLAALVTILSPNLGIVANYQIWAEWKPSLFMRLSDQIIRLFL